MTDSERISESEKEKVKGSKILIVNCLRIEPHHSHLNLFEALDFISEIAPEKAFISHISHRFGTHEEIQEMLPKDVYVAYDGLKVQF